MTGSGHIFASRAIIQPFRLSAFKEQYSSLMAIFIIRILLQLYVIYIILAKLVSYGSIEKILNASAIINIGQNVIIILF